MNWAFASSAKRPPLATSSSNVPLSITRPLSNTRMRVALRMVESRCAITKVVRPLMNPHPDVPPQCGQLQPADIHAVDLDDTGLRIEGAVQQRDRGRFAGAGRADQRDGLAGQGGERKILDRGPLAVVGKRDVVE